MIEQIIVVAVLMAAAVAVQSQDRAVGTGKAAKCVAPKAIGQAIVCVLIAGSLIGLVNLP